MRCCAQCFGDRHLTKQIIPSLATATGKCAYCGAENQQLVEPIALRDFFELLIGAYQQSAEGKSLVRLLKDDWALFPSPIMDDAHSKELMSEILDNGELVRKLFTPVDSGAPGTLEAWEGFRNELMHENRFFPKSIVNPERLEELLNHLLIDPAEISPIWYRARLEADGKTFPNDQMGAPPKNRASHGRANPAGIPYLYLATTPSTAVAELRPHTGETASVGRFGVAANLKIVDLGTPRRTVSPFVLEDQSQVVLLRGDIGFLERLGNELTRPVLPQSAPFDYIPSQYLCEFIKKRGYDGVMYRSSVGDGVNMALFDPGRGHVQSVTQYKVTRVSVEIAQ